MNIEDKLKQMIRMNLFTANRMTEFKDGSKVIFSNKHGIMEKYFCLVNNIWYIVKEYDGEISFKIDKLKE